MGSGDSEQNLKKVLDEAQESFLKAEKMTKGFNYGDKSKEPSLEVSRAFNNAVEIYYRAVNLIEVDSEKNPSEDEARLAFLAYYGYGMSLNWKVQFATRLDYDAMTEELGDDSHKSLLMLQQALKIASNNELEDLLDEESRACGIVAEELEEQDNYVEAYDLFQRKFSIYEKLRVDNVCLLGLGTCMFCCFLGAEEEKVDGKWLSEKAPTAIGCLEKIYTMCDLAVKGDKDTLARFSLLKEDREAYLEQQKVWAKNEIEALKGRYLNADTCW